MKRSYSMSNTQGYGDSQYKRRRYSSSRGSSVRRIQNSALSAPQTLAVERIAVKKTKAVLARNVEKKYYQNNTGLQGIDSADGLVYHITADLDRGDGNNQFNGPSIRPTKVTFRWIWDFSSLADETASYYSSVRLMFIQGRGDILSDVDNSVDYFLNNNYGQYNHLAPYNISYKQNFNVLYDSGPVSCTTRANFTGEKGLAWSGEVTIFKNQMNKIWYTNTESPTVNKNPIFCVAISDSTAAPHPLLYVVMDMEFIDEM